MEPMKLGSVDEESEKSIPKELEGRKAKDSFWECKREEKERRSRKMRNGRKREMLWHPGIGPASPRYKREFAYARPMKNLLVFYLLEFAIRQSHTIHTVHAYITDSPCPSSSLGE